MTKISESPKAYIQQQEQTVWKFCPPNLKTWESFYQRGFMALEECEEKVGDLTQYETPTTLGAAAGMAPQRAKIQSLKHFRDAELGDIVIAAKGKSTILGIGLITGAYSYQPRKSDFPHLRKVDWVITRALSIPSISLPGRHFVPISNWERVHSLYQEHYPELTATLAALETPTHTLLQEDSEKYLFKGYTRKEALEELFLDEISLDKILHVLSRKKNIVLQGPPGVGKTYIAQKLAFLQTGYQDRSRIEGVQLHPSYAYEDFVQGIRPGKGGGFERVNGIFLSFCERARKDPNRPYFFILDEINRANLSQLLGELFMLLEPDKRSAQFALPLTYAESPMERFFIPPNLHLIGTMNTADRSLASMDFALRRRFAFIDLKPEFGDKFQRHLHSMGVEADLIQRIVQGISRVNGHIRQDPYLGKGYEIGHSFFCHLDPTEEESSWYRLIIETEIGPLLASYWPEQPERVEKLIQELIK